MSESTQTPDWLKSIEQNSWQIELLISGGLIYTLYSLPEQINSYLGQVIINSNFSTSHVILFMVAFVTSKALLIGFGINLFLRALWLAMLGIHFSYPEGIRYDKLNYSEEFKELKEAETTTQDKILWLEKWSSLTYSIAIMLSMICVGAILIVSALFHFILRHRISQEAFNSEVLVIGSLIIVLIISLGGIDWLVFRFLRGKQKATSRYSAVSKVLSALNLSIFFKREWLTLISNNKRWRIYLIVTLYFFTAAVSTFQDLDETQIEIGKSFDLFDDRKYKEPPAYQYKLDNDEYDEHLSSGDVINAASIPAEVIEGSLLPVFISYDQMYDRILGYYFDSLNVYSSWNQMPRDSVSKALMANTAKVADVLDLIFIVHINDVRQDAVDWMYRTHPKTNQEGWATKLDISTLPKGKHALNIQRQDIGTEDKGIFTVRWIPFWKD